MTTPTDGEVAELVERLRLHRSWRDSHGELNDAPNLAADMLLSLSRKREAIVSEEMLNAGNIAAKGLLSDDELRAIYLAMEGARVNVFRAAIEALK